MIYLLAGNKSDNKHFIVITVLLKHCPLHKKITKIETLHVKLVERE